MKEYSLGAPLNTEDNRDISLASVAHADGVDITVHPKKNITDISMLPIEDQKKNGSCVGQAEGKDAEFQNYIETGKVVRLSKRALYALCKAQDGLSAEGTYPRIASAIRVSTGIPEESLIGDDNDLPHAEYIKVTMTNALKTNASQYRSKGYASVTTLDELKTAIDKVKAFNATLFVGDWSKLPVKPLNADGSNRGTHRIFVFGYEDAKNGKIDDTKVYYLNSWGIKWAKGSNSADRKLLEKGIGWFWWSEYANGYFRDATVYTDMPNELIDYAKAQQYIFPRQLQRGMVGTDVMELQKRLDKEIAFDGKKCYVADYYDTHFGALTEASVQRYQKTKGIVSHGTPATTGYGRVGAQTLAVLNAPIDPQKPAGSQIEKWADAIQVHEGWYPGSRSYRNNNPGNIKYIGQKRAIGSDGTFCKFATYEDGRAELIDLLTRASSGKSSIYYPDMNLIDFYNKYAPSSDNNDPNAYANAVAKSMGISVYSKIKNILDGTAKLSSNASTGSTTKDMKNITSSASKLVLLYIVAILGLLALFAGVHSIMTGTFDKASEVILGSFGTVITLVLGYYFGYKGDPQPVINEDDEVTLKSGFGK